MLCLPPDPCNRSLHPTFDPIRLQPAKKYPLKYLQQHEREIFGDPRGHIGPRTTRILALFKSSAVVLEQFHSSFTEIGGEIPPHKAAGSIKQAPHKCVNVDIGVRSEVSGRNDGEGFGKSLNDYINEENAGYNARDGSINGENDGYNARYAHIDGEDGGDNGKNGYIDGENGAHRTPSGSTDGENDGYIAQEVCINGQNHECNAPDLCINGKNHGSIPLHDENEAKCDSIKGVSISIPEDTYGSKVQSVPMNRQDDGPKCQDVSISQRNYGYKDHDDVAIHEGYHGYKSQVALVRPKFRSTETSICEDSQAYKIRPSSNHMGSQDLKINMGLSVKDSQVVFSSRMNNLLEEENYSDQCKVEEHQSSNETRVTLKEAPYLLNGSNHQVKKFDLPIGSYNNSSHYKGERKQVVNPREEKASQTTTCNASYPYDDGDGAKIRMPTYRAPFSKVSESIIYLKSLGADCSRILGEDPSIIVYEAKYLRELVSALEGYGLKWQDLGRIFNLCPKILRLDPETDLKMVTSFLFEEVGLARKDFGKVIKRCPRLLACSVDGQLQPTLKFLRELGFRNMSQVVSTNATLLSFSVENKILPKLRYLESFGFDSGDVISMVIRFPAIFNYSDKENLLPKYKYLINEMGRCNRDLLSFPQYFGYSLERKIRPRYERIARQGVSLSLQAMLKLSEAEFNAKFDRVNNVAHHSKDVLIPNEPKFRAADHFHLKDASSSNILESPEHYVRKPVLVIGDLVAVRCKE